MKERIMWSPYIIMAKQIDWMDITIHTDLNYGKIIIQNINNKQTKQQQQYDFSNNKNKHKKSKRKKIAFKKVYKLLENIREHSKWTMITTTTTTKQAKQWSMMMENEYTKMKTLQTYTITHMITHTNTHIQDERKIKKRKNTNEKKNNKWYTINLHCV